MRLQNIARIRTVSLLLATTLSVGCSRVTVSSPPVPAQGATGNPLQSRKLSVDGTERDFLLYVPKQSIHRVCPVLISLHGRGGKADSVVWGLKLKEAADKFGFILISPQAIHKGVWQDGASAYDPRHELDLAFFKALVRLVPSLGGDPRRVYAMGISNGGAMAFRLGAELPDKFAAVCGVGASVGALTPDLQYRCLPEPKLPISVLHVHGMQDQICGYDMRTFTVPAPDAALWWARAVGAKGKPEHKVIGHGEILFDRYLGRQGSEIILLSYKDAGHEWPLRFNQSTGVDINDFMWSFFTRHRLSNSSK